ncbi:hypothetical protein FZI85_10100 [Mycobacterium sp. CBMA293]|uniref:PAS domain-containing protein n=1 Tax=unclassified Mycolicibacterium TaxID=2636767 RepID=UPI0012DC9169|nr:MULTISPECIES: PAS domain-containing protein [unclassified Mycolicibacterium]MUL46062.1 hypothetical protein [Mycolicibacterium sp. CBMA 360]MUL58891.1 hypothetical protein [Mycolicibacterium sp. CBMA 335]MUL69285.1 hypothetical protein [Mycolicibacterium sp. CBMA 311]MUL94249.1 hypothetical protein [Mycolicibacterium sp. CBMA 230]MUM05264.1 hypothetical protein [Mycolicibacterium sp. CBMA 213]
MTDDWLLVETLGAEPAVVAEGQQTKNMVPISTFLRRNSNLMAIQSAIGETVRAGLPLTSITPKSDLVIRTEVVQMTDGRIHGVHVWVGGPNADPPDRMIPGPLKWDLTNGVATDTMESLANSGLNPAAEATHGRAFADDLQTRKLKPNEARVISAVISPKPGQTFTSTWDMTDFRGRPISVGFAARVLNEPDEDGRDRLTCRAMNWRGVRDNSSATPLDRARRIVNGPPVPGVYRAMVDLNSWKLIKWIDETCPFFDWNTGEAPESVVHPDEMAEMAVMTVEFASGPTSRVLRLRANDGGWVPIHVTAHRLEVADDTFAGLLSLRLPTYGELIEAGDRLGDDTSD